MVNRQRSSSAGVAPPELDLSTLEKSLHGAYESYLLQIRQEPRSADAWGQLGMFMFAHHFEREANICLGEAARLDPQQFRWPYLLGLSLSVSDPDVAILYWNRVTELQPSLAIVHLRMGELYLHLRQTENARRSIQLGLLREPEQTRGLLAMAHLQLDDNEPEASLQWLGRIPSEKSNIRSVYELRSQIQQRLGNHAAALQDLSVAEQLPDVPLVWRDPIAAEVLAMRHEARAILERAEMLIDQQQIPQAISLLQEALTFDQRDPQVHSALARAYLQISRLPQAESILAVARQQHPHSVEVWFQSGVVAFASERFNAAAAYFRSALECKPTHALAHYNLGHTFLKLGDHSSALESFGQAVLHRPSFVDAHINLARLLLQAGERQRAIEHVRIAKQLRPQDPGVAHLVRELPEA